MTLLQDELTRSPGVALASCAMAEPEHIVIVHVRMTPDSSQTAGHVVQEALRAMQRTCERFTRRACESILLFDKAWCS